MEKDTVDSNYIMMIDRAFQVIEYISKNKEPAGVSRIAKDLNLPKSNTFRILNTLCKWNALEQIVDDKYGLGKALIKYGNIAKERINIQSVAEPIVRQLCKDVGESANLGIIYESSVLTVLTCQGEYSTLVSKLIPISPMHCSSLGKIFLAQLSDDEIKAHFSKYVAPDDKRTLHTITTADDFLKIKDEIKQNNLAFDEEEYEYGLSCISSGIKSKSGEIIAAISLSGPTSRLNVKGMDYLSAKVKESGENLSENIQIIE